MKHITSIGRAAALALLAALTTGCMGMRVIDVSQPVSTGASVAPAPAGARIALQVVAHWPNPSPTTPWPIETGIRNKYQSQLNALGYQVVTPAEAGSADPVLRVDVRQHATGADSMTVIFPIFSAFILPATASDHFMIDTALIREGQVLGVSRQTLRRRYWMHILPFVLLYGGMEGPASYEPSVMLNTELLALAQQQKSKGI